MVVNGRREYFFIIFNTVGLLLSNGRQNTIVNIPSDTHRSIDCSPIDEAHPVRFSSLRIRRRCFLKLFSCFYNSPSRRLVRALWYCSEPNRASWFLDLHCKNTRYHSICVCFMRVILNLIFRVFRNGGKRNDIGSIGKEENAFHRSQRNWTIKYDMRIVLASAHLHVVFSFFFFWLRWLRPQNRLPCPTSCCPHSQHSQRMRFFSIYLDRAISDHYGLLRFWSHRL